MCHGGSAAALKLGTPSWPATTNTELSARRGTMRATMPQSTSVSGAPTRQLFRPYVLSARRGRTASILQARAARYDRRRPPPPDLPSLLFDQRIVYMGMPMVPAVTELIVAELMYLEKNGQGSPIEMLINSSGTTRQDGEILAFDSEGIALTSTMGFIKSPISTVNMGLAVGWAAVVLSFGKKGWRKSLPHSLAMLQQPRVPPTGQRQAVEVHIKWREVLDYKRELLRLLSVGTGWSVDKLDYDMQRPLYMRPAEAIEYGLIDEIIAPNRDKQAAAAAYWVKSGRAESEGRLEQWADYLQQQELYNLKDAQKKTLAQEYRAAYRETSEKLLSQSDRAREDMAAFKRAVPQELLTAEDELRLPFSQEGLKMALLNAERYAERNVQRRVKAGKVKMPAAWQEQMQDAAQASPPPEQREVDYGALIRAVEAMDESQFGSVDLDQLVQQYSKPGSGSWN